jgi:hypothetical protein
MNARDQMLAREQLQLQRLYAHSAGNVGVNVPHPSNVGTPRLGPSAQGPNLGPGPLSITGSPRATTQPAPLGIGARYSSPSHGQGQGQGQGLSPKPVSAGSTTLSATAAPFVFGQTQNSVPPASTSGAAFLRSSGDADAVPLNSDKLSNGNMDFEGDQGTNFNFESDGGSAAAGGSGQGPVEESSEVEAMSRRFLTGSCCFIHLPSFYGCTTHALTEACKHPHTSIRTHEYIQYIHLHSCQSSHSIYVIHFSPQSYPNSILFIISCFRIR